MSVINNYNDNTLVSGTSSADTIYNYGSKVTLNGGARDDSVKNWGKLVVINGDAGNDSIENYIERVTINGGAGNDTVFNYDSRVLLYGGDGNDLLWTGYDTSNNVTLNTGAGNDTVEIVSPGRNYINVGEGSNLFRLFRDNEIIVNGSDGNESILVYANREDSSHSMPDIAMTINSSRGNDTVNGFDYARGVYSYSPNHGNDVILGFGNQSTLKVNGTIDRWSLDGSDVVFTVGQGSVRLKNGKGHVLNVSDNNGAVSTVFGGSYSYSQQDVLKDFMRSLNQTTLTSTADMVDEAINSCSKGKYKNLSAAVDAFISDCRGVKGDVDKFLQEYCGIYVDNADMGAITSWDAGGSTVKNYYNVVPSSSTKNPLA
ncbi:MAG: hypothetical protein IJU71_09635 [Selenomonadaceae bacterium]|nr:hypothetical protein [Selenomonadaceae bacterium]